MTLFGKMHRERRGSAASSRFGGSSSRHSTAGDTSGTEGTTGTSASEAELAETSFRAAISPERLQERYTSVLRHTGARHTPWTMPRTQ